jgi:hypothetical protein
VINTSEDCIAGRLGKRTIKPNMMDDHVYSKKDLPRKRKREEREEEREQRRTRREDKEAAKKFKHQVERQIRIKEQKRRSENDIEFRLGGTSVPQQDK